MLFYISHWHWGRGHWPPPVKKERKKQQMFKTVYVINYNWIKNYRRRIQSKLVSFKYDHHCSWTLTLFNPIQLMVTVIMATKIQTPKSNNLFSKLDFSHVWTSTMGTWWSLTWSNSVFSTSIQRPAAELCWYFAQIIAPVVWQLLLSVSVHTVVIFV